MSFLRVDGEKLDGRLVPKHVWNADLINFDGPLLSLFKSDDGEDVLYSWLDCSASRNRWCMVPVSRQNLRSYLESAVSLRHLFEVADSLIVFDVGNSAKRSGYTRTVFNRLPEEYKPDQGSFLFPEIATSAARKLVEDVTEDYFIGLDREFYIDDLSLVPRIYQQLYSFHYGLEHLGRDAVRGALSRAMAKWTGGFSAVNIFSGLKSVIPSIHRPWVAELRFNSPGHIRLNLLPRMAKQIERAATRICDEQTYYELEELYKAVYRYFTKEGIAGFEDERRKVEVVLPSTVLDQLSSYVDQFFNLMDWTGYRVEFDAVEANALQQVRVLLAYYRRIKRLRPYMVRGQVTLGKSPLTPQPAYDSLI